MKLVIHAGPAKTGSTAFQRTVETLRDDGHLRDVYFRFSMDHAGAQTANMRKQLTNALASGASLTLLSNEYLPVTVGDIDWAKLPLDQYGTKQAVMVYRPLTKVYPSLYFQQLRPPRRATITFDAFVEARMKLDLDPRPSYPTHNYACLDQRLLDAGFETHWVRYQHDTLLDRLLPACFGDDRLAHHIAVPLEQVLNAATQVRPNRSPSFWVAPMLIELNRAFHSGELDENAREHIARQVFALGGRVPYREVSTDLRARIQALDHEVNGDFYRRMSIHESGA